MLPIRLSGLPSTRRAPARGPIDSAVADQALDSVGAAVNALGRTSSRILLLVYDGTLAPFR